MAAYNSYFSGPQSAKQKWDLSDVAAKTIYDTWMLTEDELTRGTYPNAFLAEATTSYKAGIH